MNVFGSVSVDCGSFLCQTSWLHGVEPIEWVLYNKIESCTIQAFWGPQVCFLCFSTYPRHFSGSLEYWHQQPTFAKQKLHYQWKPYSNAAKVSICQQRHACQFAIRQWVDSGAFCLRMFTRMDSIGQIRICSNHIIISSYHASYVILSIRLNCFEQLSQFVALATRGHGGELLQEQTIIVECLDGLEEHCHHLCLKLKKKPACHRAPVFEGFWHPLLWINIVDSSLFTPGEVVSHCFDCQLCSGLIPRFLSKLSRLP